MDVEDPNLNTEQSPHTFLILRDVKRYVESMSERNLSLKIQMYGLNTTLMSKYFCLPMIKEFALYVDYRLWGTSAVDSGLTHISTLGLKIDQLTAALAGMACLQKFFWNASFSTNYYAKRLPEISEIAPQLVKLQKIFLTLRHLRSFIIEGFIFHPHFFLRPPGSLKELRILGSMGFSWWQQFAKCSLVGLENLFIHGELEVPQFTYQPQVDFTMPADIPLQNSFCLGSVSVHGLRKFKIFGLCDLPTDFEDCIVRNNPSLDEESIQHIWLRQGAPIASTCCRRVEGRALAAARTLWSSLPSQFTGSEAGDSLKSQATQEYTRLFISSSDKIHGNEEETENAWKDIEDRVQRELMGRVNLCTKYVSNRYMHRYPNPESATQLEDQFLNDCLKTMGELSGVENWLSAERHIKEVAHVSLTRMRNQIKKVGPKWADIFGKALRQDQKVDIEGTIDDWVPKLVEMYEEDKEEKDLRLERLLDIQTEPHCRGTHTGALDSLLSGWTSG
ncbi:uncharacterized protein DFL_000375 [Arthrobotrys flagrans]|uniref:Uncharacterized protein n=1 Tax=Arthrobotrys flagrans TaxID=97331 RepID=A0A437ADL0_ARTFL|nr:hypothetical protein DFL_000375 [Arthrobotrys flagrans]